ncbi:Hypothetical protein HVR_LOCUS756, partial [uncultured virus]
VIYNKLLINASSTFNDDVNLSAITNYISRATSSEELNRLIYFATKHHFRRLYDRKTTKANDYSHINGKHLFDNTLLKYVRNYKYCITLVQSTHTEILIFNKDKVAKLQIKNIVDVSSMYIINLQGQVYQIDFDDLIYVPITPKLTIADINSSPLENVKRISADIDGSLLENVKLISNDYILFNNGNLCRRKIWRGSDILIDIADKVKDVFVSENSRKIYLTEEGEVHIIFIVAGRSSIKTTTEKDNYEMIIDTNGYPEIILLTKDGRIVSRNKGC